MVLDEQQLIKSFLSQYFFDAQERNPRFSVRAFAKKLGVSSSALSEILRGKRKLSEKKALRYAEIINLDGKSRQMLLDAFQKAGSLEKLKQSPNPLREVILTPDQFHIMADRIYFSVLAMMRANCKSPTEIGQRLNLDFKTVKDVQEELAKIGVLKKVGSDYLEVERVVFRTSEDFPDELMKQRRLQNNKASKNAIEKNLSGQSGFFSTVAVDRDRLDEVGNIVEDFVKRLSLFLRKPGSEDVFEINVDIFPWSN